MQLHELYDVIAAEANIDVKRVQSTVELLDDGNTVPFIARYRKEVTGGLDEVQIRFIEDRIRYLRTLEERKATVLESIEKQGKLSDALHDKISRATKLQEVEDLYLPFRPKKRTRATIAKERGLEPLAEMILAQQLIDGSAESAASQFIDPEKDVHDAEAALAGAKDIVAEVIADDADIRAEVREFSYHTGILQTKARSGEKNSVYEMYADFNDPVKKLRPHNVLAINRGEREGFLKVSIDVDTDNVLAKIQRLYVRNKQSVFNQHILEAIEDSYHRLIAPSIERDIRSHLTEKADSHAIEVFAENVRNLLLAAPMRDTVIMGIDPGFRSGCKVAVIDATGKYLEGSTIYPHPPQKRWDYAKIQLQDLIKKHNVAMVAIGNGTASRETEQLVAEVIQEYGGELYYTIVSEAGASVYSASEVAAQEFPDLPVEMRGNISIARRLLDPLSELVKIDPKSIGVGLYQHDVNQTQLADSLDRVVESAVNYVGVNLNTASKSLLRYVAGINSRTAENIVKYREQNGIFKSREELTKVKGLGEAAFTQAAGFLRIPDGDVFFDSTAVHPESYKATENLLNLFELSEDEIKKDGRQISLRLNQSKLKIAELAERCGTGIPTLEDIVASLEKPNRDPRDEMPKPILRSDVLKMEDLNEGMILKGTVRNVVDFGAFVDIGLKSDGLVHKSRMADKFVKNPMDIVSVGDVIDVKIISVDEGRGRISLSMVL